MTAFFDLRERFTVTGTLSKLDWRNPHIYLLVNVASNQGQVEAWSFEGPAPSVFRDGDLSDRVGRRDFENSVGEMVVVEASPARNDSRSGLIRQITFADGMELSLCPGEC